MNVAPESMNKGATSDQEMNMMQAPKSEIGVAIEALADQINQTDNPDEQQILNKVVEKLDLNQKEKMTEVPKLPKEDMMAGLQGLMAKGE